MDPLSVAANLVAVISAANATHKGLCKLIALKDVPDLVLALNNEVQDLHLTFREIEYLQFQHDEGGDTHRFLTSVVLPNAHRARASLQELEGLLEYRLKKADGSVNRGTWLRIEGRVRRLQRELRHARISITTTLSISTTSTIARLETKLDKLQLVTSSNQQTLPDQTQVLERAVMAMLDAHKRSEARLASLEDLMLTRVSSDDSQSSTFTGSSDETLLGPPDPKLDVSHPWRDGSNSEVDHFSALRMKFLLHRRCNPYCSCDCHRTTRFTTPRSLQFIVGALFVGYSNVPKLTPPCSTPKCHGGAEGLVSMNYYFPRWLVSRAIAMAVRFANHRGPEMSISTLHLRDGKDLIFEAAASGDSATVHRLLANGDASVVDVASGTGHTPLHLAVMRSHAEVISTLLHFGAKTLLENATQETPYDMAWSTILCFGDTPNSETFRVDEIQNLFPSTAALEERRTFSRIHQIVLKLIHLDLETELKSGRSGIDTPDSDGRTALHWAAGRGDEKSVSMLLRYGADPDHADRIGQGPLRSSMKASDPSCMERLINAGANVMQTDHWGQTCLQAAMYYSDPVGFGVPLIHAGVDINAQDSTKSFPLLEAVRMKQYAAMTMLLDNGADVNISDVRGLTPFLEAVARNDHRAVRMLLRTRAIDATAKDNRRCNVLHYAARCADMDMIQILASARLEDLNISIVQEDGLSAIEIAEKRWLDEFKGGDDEKPSPVDESWIKMFTALIESVTDRDPVTIPPFKDEEDQSTEYHTASPADSLYLDANCAF